MRSKLASKAILALADVVLINAAVVLIFAFDLHPRVGIDRERLSAAFQLAPWLSVFTVMAFYVTELYDGWLRKSRAHLLRCALASVVLVTGMAAILSLLVTPRPLAQAAIIGAMPFQYVCIVAYRALVWRAHRKYSRSRRLLIIGSNDEECQELFLKFQETHGSWFDLRPPLTTGDLGMLDSLLPTVDVVAFSAKFSRRSDVMSCCAAFGKEVLIVPDTFELLLFRAEEQTVDDVLMLSIRPMQLSRIQRAAKRMLDLIGSALLIVVTSPVQLVLCVLIPLSSKGSPIFRQERVGRDGQVYILHKFRTMILDAEKTTGPTLVSKRDPRITRLGALLRSTRLDELPQLFDVFRGVMSLVGPRPERPYFVRQFQSVLPDYRFRLAVKPGITGLAQINGRYSTGVEDKLRFDLLYLHNYSVALDFKILLRTVGVVLQPAKASGVAAGKMQREITAVPEPRAQAAASGSMSDD